MVDNKLQVVNKGDSVDFVFNPEEMNHLGQSIQDYIDTNHKFPTEVIMGEELAQRYLNSYKQGVPFKVLFKNRAIYITVNIRFRADNLLIR
jgi:hypothetical protein